jgi:hypothetical protein
MGKQYLYLKTHNITGMKYLGKTHKDPFRYRGSGVYWIRHLKSHGNDVKTEILKECNTKEEVIYWGEYYSDLWDVVKSKEFANLQRETGDGRDPESVLGEKNPNYGNKWSKEQKEKLSEYRKQFIGEKNPMYGKKRKDLSERNKKPKHWMTNGEVDKLILIEDYDYYISIGFQKGRCNGCEKLKITNKGKKFSENHKKNLMGSNNAKSIYWKITFADGSVIIQCGLTNWAKENGYDSIAIRKIASGKVKTHKDIVLVEKINP